MIEFERNGRQPFDDGYVRAGAHTAQKTHSAAGHAELVASQDQAVTNWNLCIQFKLINWTETLGFFL